MERRYRNDIQGIRALAVILVVLYHLHVPYISSGLLGVDVFFVISGYLITAIIYRDIEKKDFSLRKFYLRRMRRILPALLFVLFFTSLAALLILFPSDLKHYSTSLLAALLFVSNIYFWKIVPSGYFQTNTNLIPLIHLWSLGVEEQFYIFWPLLLCLGTKFFSKKIFFIIALIFAILSFVISIWFWVRGHSSAAFYCPVSRSFELLLGSILALYGSKIPNFSKRYNESVAFFGLSLILFVGCLTKPNTELSSLWQFAICFGTVLVIYSGLNYKTVVSSFLSFRPLTFIGLISYSLYLWHWPIIAYVRYLDINISWSIKILIFFVSIALAFISYVVFEDPFRKKIKFSFLKSFVFFLVIPLIFAIGFMFFVKKTQGYESRFTAKTLLMLNTLNNPGVDVLGKDCFGGDPSHPASEEKCLIGDKSEPDAKVLLIGDSHAAADINMVATLLEHAKLKGRVVTLASSPYLPGIPAAPYEQKEQLQRNEALTKIIRNNHFKYIVMAGHWASYDDEFNNCEVDAIHYFFMKHGLINALKIITRQSAIPIVILDTPPPLSVDPRCSVVSEIFHRKDMLCQTSLKQIKEIEAPSREMILALQKHFPQIIFIDPSKVLCNKSVCFSNIGSTSVYFDNMFDVGIQNNGHLTAAASKKIADLYLQKYPNPFLVKQG